MPSVGNLSFQLSKALATAKASFCTSTGACHGLIPPESTDASLTRKVRFSIPLLARFFSGKGDDHERGSNQRQLEAANRKGQGEVGQVDRRRSDDRRRSTGAIPRRAAT